jgi:hypothetical protein
VAWILAHDVRHGGFSEPETVRATDRFADAQLAT